MNKTAIKNFAIWARKKLISDIIYKARTLGITEDGIAEPLEQSTSDLQFFDIGASNYVEVSGKQIAQRNALVYEIKNNDKDFKEAFHNVVDSVAYTWFNRLIAIRFMEVNDYLPSGIRVLSSTIDKKDEPDFVTNPFDTDLQFTPYEQDRVYQLKDENKLDELFRMLFIKQCNKLHDILPELFETIDDYTELLLTISFTDEDGVVHHLVHDIDEEDFDIEAEGQVQIIGWLYQYYNTEPKDLVFANLKKNIKVSKENIPAATQLFTPDWIVRYMVENSLGRLWLEGHNNDNLKSQWEYYLDEAEQESDVQAQLDIIKKQYAELKLTEIKCIDPCMGSGHILVYMFDVLMQIYESQGYMPRDAARLIVENNLYGLDIDKRAYQLAYFAVMMKGRQYDRRFLTRGIKPHLSHFQDLPKANVQFLKEPLRSFVAQYENADVYGSLICPKQIDGIDEAIDSFSSVVTLDLVQLKYLKELNTVLSQKYDVVCTNPPYMGGSNMNGKLSDFVKKNYPDSKSDLFACFIEKGFNFAKKDGFMCMVTMQSWMFLSSFEKMRTKALTTKTITNLMHMENMVMGIAFGTAVTVFKNSHIKGYKGTYNQIKLEDIEHNIPKKFPVMENRFAQVSAENFSKIPGSPVAYWCTDSMYRVFDRSVRYGELADARRGTVTGNDDRFLKLWFEIGSQNFSIFSPESDKWFPMNKGGEYRKWYGNNFYVVDWANNGYEIKNFKDDKGKLRSRPQNTNYFFRKGITWTYITSYQKCFRFYPEGFCFAGVGPGLFPHDEIYLYYMLSYCNSNVYNSLMKMMGSSTISLESGEVDRSPIIIDHSRIVGINTLTKNNISLSKTDWDGYETSWDFEKHPLVQLCHGVHDSNGNEQTYIEDAFNEWNFDCDERFRKLKANEEELNRIFIDIYGLQDELTPEVEDKDVTVHCIYDTKEDIPENLKGSNYVRTKRDEIVSLISYAVGCMFGRYSLDVEGLAFAGGEWDESKYKTFIPDEDNCIPITDEEYFKDDIVGRFVEFIRVVYGDDTLEDNLDFIADALGNKGKTSREVIRNYFLNDFIKDHIKTYQKRPIYWLFDSGKQNGFKALVYMHRWNADTTGNMRVEYLHRMQRVYEKEIERMQEIVDNSRDNREVSAATKRKEKLTKQLKETKEFDAKVAHLALSRIDIDLDDGVKVNYEKVQTTPDGKKMQILAKI